ncbi:MAG: DUF1800 family protein [Deltaproteobacteria bacterium]|nr:DUF1800 family protein [Deltaproteobacteria bacterium]
MSSFLRSIIALLLCVVVAVPQAQAASSWRPNGSTMLGSSAACYRNGSQGELKVRTSLGGGRYSYKTYKLKDFKSINGKVKDLGKKIAKAGSASLKKTLKKQQKEFSVAADRLSQCAMALDKPIGCKVTLAQLPAMKVVAGFGRVIPIQATSSCAGTPSLMVASAPSHGTLLAESSVVRYTAALGSSGPDTASVRVCYSAEGGVVKGCSTNLPLQLSVCSIQATSGAQSVFEHRSSSFTLQGTSDCGSALRYELVRNANPGTVTVQASGGAAYRVGFYAGSDSFSYRICDADGAGCSAEQNVPLNVFAGDNFQGNPESLEPYRAHVSPEERRHLVRKIANNRFDLIAGQGETMPLASLLENRFLSNDVFAPDLRSNLEGIRDDGAVYGQPIDSEEFIPGWKNDFSSTEFYGASDPRLFRPILPSALNFDTADEMHYGMERWMMTTHRSWHSGNHRYHWGWDYSVAHYLTKARYLSPVNSKLTNFWMGHFGTNTQVVDGFKENLVGYYVKTIEREVFGNFRSLMLGTPGVADEDGCAPIAPWQPNHGSILCDPVSNIWLSNVKNTGENQNFARELMELYLMSPTDEVSNARNYEEPEDIIAATRFVSGIRVEQYKNIGTNYLFAAKSDPDVPSWMPTPVPGPRYHDIRPASMFGSLGAADPGLPIVNRTMRPGEFVRHLLDKHPGVPRFIAGKLFSSLVYPDPSDDLVEELGTRLKALDYNLKEFLKLILGSEAMFSPRAAGRNCISSPLEVYSKLFNTIEFPLMTHEDAAQAQVFYYHNIGLGGLQNAGEVPLGYPSVFTYDYCGRDPGKDGSTAWLKSYLLIFRVTSLTTLLSQHAYRFPYDLADAMDVIQAKPPFQDGSAQSFLGFFEQAFDLHLNSAERAIFMEYLTHRRTGSGGLVSVTWNPNDAALMREKIAGMLAILSVFQQSATH